MKASLDRHDNHDKPATGPDRTRQDQGLGCPSPDHASLESKPKAEAAVSDWHTTPMELQCQATDLKVHPAYLVVRQASHAGPHLFGGGAQGAEDLKELVDLRVSWEQGTPGHHLSKDAAHRPHVHWAGVLALAEEDLRGTVPQRNNLEREGRAREQQNKNH